MKEARESSVIPAVLHRAGCDAVRRSEWHNDALDEADFAALGDLNRLAFPASFVCSVDPVPLVSSMLNCCPPPDESVLDAVGGVSRNIGDWLQ